MCQTGCRVSCPAPIKLHFCWLASIDLALSDYCRVIYKTRTAVRVLKSTGPKVDNTDARSKASFVGCDPKATTPKAYQSSPVGLDPGLGGESRRCRTANESLLVRIESVYLVAFLIFAQR